MNALKSVVKRRFCTICLVWIFRGSVAYVITSSHFDNIDSSEETNACRPSEQNRNDCETLSPTPVPRLVQTVPYLTNKHRFWSFEPPFTMFHWKFEQTQSESRACMKTNTK